MKAFNKWLQLALEFAAAGLIVAEIELPSEDFEIDIPSWVGEEVTSDPSYLNAELFKKL